MAARVWALATAIIGVLILVILAAFGTEYGTWVDEAGPLPTAPPTFVLPFLVGGLALVLVVGGLVSAVVSVVRSRAGR
jgi:hypothetical protein